ncbi:hypothetical protein ACFL1V_01440 [Pseudomonadota bacterium]
MKTSTLTLVFVLLSATFVQTAWGQNIYKCETADGVVFSSQPCAVDAQKVRPHDGSGGADVIKDEEVISSTEPDAHEGPILKTLGGQMRDNKTELYDIILNKKSPQKRCGEWYDKYGMLVVIPCNDLNTEGNQ